MNCFVVVFSVLVNVLRHFSATSAQAIINAAHSALPLSSYATSLALSYSTSAFQFAGKRHAVKLTPMQHLTKIVEQVSELAKQQLDSSNCKIYYNKKELDLSTPARFANLPSGATLELKTGTES